MFRTFSVILFLFIFSVGIVQGETIYEVKKGDSLSQIALEYGDLTYWYKIYKANQDKIEDPTLIYPGQKLTIPKKVADHKKSLSNPDDNNQLTENKTKQLEKFRKAFKKVVRDNKQTDKPAEVSKQSASDIGLGGMVLNETRSKMGNNFYSIFYKQWEAPKNTGNYTIKISERPIPSRGTLIEVKIDDQTVFKNRLEPRYYKTKQTAFRAVYLCQKQLQRQMASNSDFQGY